MSSKLREALENARSLIYEGIETEVDDDIAHPFHLELAIEKIDKALAAPSEPVGNVAKLREALIIVYDWILKAGHVYGYSDTEQKRRQLYDMMTKALSAPPRNCDVGTAKEQSVRMAEFCREQYKKTDGVMLCSGCRFHDIRGLDCQFAWAQMPYEEGVAE